MSTQSLPQGELDHTEEEALYVIYNNIIIIIMIEEPFQDLTHLPHLRVGRPARP